MTQDNECQDPHHQPFARPLQLAPGGLWSAVGAIAVLACLMTSCISTSGPEVIVYAALDQEFSEPILDDFAEASGIAVRGKYDVESTKTVGLVKVIMGEQGRPRCDLFWNNEILHTLRLQRAGLLDSYRVATADDFPAAYRDPNGQWYGLAARARVLLVNTEIVPREQWPTSLHGLVDPRWKGKVGIAKPRFGTTATHAAVLFSQWGDEKAREFFQAVEENVQVLSGNKQVASAVGQGQLAFGLTDTDDAMIEIDKGRAVQMVFPDQQEGQSGALFIPNTLCLIKDSPNPQQARQLMDYLLAPDVEIRLARGRSAQFPVNRTVQQRSRAFPVDDVRWMDVDFAQAADQWDAAQAVLREIFSQGW